MLTPNVVCSGVQLVELVQHDLVGGVLLQLDDDAHAARDRDSSRMSVMPSIFFSRTSSAIFSISAPC